MQIMSDQELLAAIGSFEKIVVSNPTAQQFINEYKQEFLRRREEEHEGVSTISVTNHCGDVLNPFALFDSDFNNLSKQLCVTLPRICRFWGQTETFYSVAQHCLSMVKYFEGDRELQKIALIHEAFEGLTGMDVATPVKRMLPAYKAAEERALASIARLHGLTYPFPDLIKRIDKGLMAMEGEALMKNGNTNWRSDGDPVGSLYKKDVSMEEISSDFNDMFSSLFGSSFSLHKN